MQSLAEAYRPASLEAVLGHDHIKAGIRALRARGGLGGRAYWISGKSGAGKTTLAKLIAAELAEPWNVTELDAGEAGLPMLRDAEEAMYFRGMGERAGRVWIVNEAHGLRSDAIRKLLVMLERLPEWSAWVFTTTLEGQSDLFDDHIDASPLLSRCVVWTLQQRDMGPLFARRALEIAALENLAGPGATEARARRLVNDNKGNMRAVLSAIEAGALL